MDKIVKWWTNEQNFSEGSVQRRLIVEGETNSQMFRFMEKNLGRACIGNPVDDFERSYSFAIFLETLLGDSETMQMIEQAAELCEAENYEVFEPFEEL